MSEPPIPDPPEIAKARLRDKGIGNGKSPDDPLFGYNDQTVQDRRALLAELDRRGEVIARVTQLRNDWKGGVYPHGEIMYRRLSRALDGTP